MSVVEAPDTGGPRVRLPGSHKKYAQVVFAGTSVAETAVEILDVGPSQEIIILARVTAIAGTPTVTVRAYKVDSGKNRYPATSGAVGAAAAIQTLTFTANNQGYIVIPIASGAVGTTQVGVGRYIEITYQYTIGGVTPAATLDIEVHVK